MKLHQIILFFVLFALTSAFGQRYGKNYPDFERRRFHFGTALGVNTTNYRYQLKEDFMQYDSVININMNSGPGFAIHLPLVSWNLHPSVHLRTIPSLTFHETQFEYIYIKNGQREVRSTRSQPTLINFPLLLKLNTKRINNFAAYALTGFSYSFDLASQINVEPKESAPIVKLSQHDFAYHVGGGFDFYLPYFKFGIEIKLTNGIKNLVVPDDTFYSAPLESIKSKIWWFSITFEG
jgi:hypothetical protein